MWGDSKLIKEHSKHPKNVGEIANPDAVALIDNSQGQLLVQITLRIHRDGRVLAMNYRIEKDCTAIPILSFLSEFIRDKLIQHVYEIEIADIEKELDGLNSTRQLDTQRCLHEISRALIQYEEQKASNLTSIDEGFYLCTCFSVTDSEIREVIKKHRLKKVEEVTQHCKAGGGCETCHPEIEAMLEGFAELWDMK